MNCPSCGTENSDGAKFCNGCGKALSGTRGMTSPSNVDSFDAGRADAGKDRNATKRAVRRLAQLSLWLGLAAFVLGLGGCGLGCVSGSLGVTASVAGDNTAAETLAGAMVGAGLLGTLFLFGGLGGIVLGAVLKAFVGDE